MKKFNSYLEEKGLWDNIHAKRKRGEKMRKPGEKGAPTAADFKNAQTKESVEQIDELSTKTLGYYVRNAADDVRAKKAKPMGTVSTKDIKKVHSRNKNIELALDKIGNKRNESAELDEAITKFVIKHKKTKQVLSTHSDYATAKDEHEGLGADKHEYGVYKQTKKDAALRNRNTYREATELDEAKLSTQQRDRLDDLILNVHMTTHPEYDGNETPDKYLKAIEKEFGTKVVKQVKDGIEIMHWGRDNRSSGYDKLSWRKGGARITKSGKMNKQDVEALKNRIKRDKQWGGITKKVKLPEEVKLDEVSTDKLRDYASAALQDKDKAKADKRWKYAGKAMKTVGDREAKAANDLKYNRKESVEEKKLTPAEKKKREEIAKAMERENPGMDMKKKMAIATWQAKKVAENGEEYPIAKSDKFKSKKVIQGSNNLDEISIDSLTKKIAGSTGTKNVKAAMKPGEVKKGLADLRKRLETLGKTTQKESVQSADVKPQKYIRPDGKVGVRMAKVDKNIVKND